MVTIHGKKPPDQMFPNKMVALEICDNANTFFYIISYNTKIIQDNFTIIK